MFVKKENPTFMEVNENPTSTLTSEEMNELKQLGNLSQELIVKFGQNEYQFQILDSQKEELIKEFESLKIKESQFIQSIQNKYGQVSINTETGEITPMN
jgi:hypothetical protein